LQLNIFSKNFFNAGLAVGLTLALYGCGGGASSGPSETDNSPQAQHSDIIIASTQPGITPFISSVRFAGRSVPKLASIAFTIATQPGLLSQPVNVTWNRAALSSRGYLHNQTIDLPVFGLYSGYQNQVTFHLTFKDGSSQDMQYLIATSLYTDPTGVYVNPTILKARAPGSALGFDFVILKSGLGSPVIVDTDGQVRWVGSPGYTASVYFGNGEFLYGTGGPASLVALQMDGSGGPLPTVLPQPLLYSFNHNIDPGPMGLLAEFDGTDSLGVSTEDIVAKIDPFGKQPPFQTYDLATILSSYMLSQGDDPTSFVRPGTDWFHVNASTYDPSDNSVIISSRENFLIKLDYSTHEIKWIFGDPAKYWYTFPSLRAKALLLDSGGLYPIGQHAVSITSDGYVMVFNNGFGSVNQPSGRPAGVTRTYSAVSVYSMNTSTMTAHEAWGFEYGQTVYSAVCGSVYEAGQSYLIDYATAASFTKARLVGLDPSRNVVFDFQYNSPSTCAAAWNAIPVSLGNLQIN
jgi:arylsulfate sulfotransferase